MGNKKDYSNDRPWSREEEAFLTKEAISEMELGDGSLPKGSGKKIAERYLRLYGPARTKNCVMVKLSNMKNSGKLFHSEEAENDIVQVLNPIVDRWRNMNKMLNTSMALIKHLKHENAQLKEKARNYDIIKTALGHLTVKG